MVPSIFVGAGFFTLVKMKIISWRNKNNAFAELSTENFQRTNDYFVVFFFVCYYPTMIRTSAFPCSICVGRTKLNKADFFLAIMLRQL